MVIRLKGRDAGKGTVICASVSGEAIHNLIVVGVMAVAGHGEGFAEAEIGQFDMAVAGDEDVVWFEVAVDN